MAKIVIVGAGLSGMVAGINLARQGYEVQILDKEKELGGSPMFHPSLHATPVDLSHTSDFIGIDISDSFQLLSDFHTWLKNKRLFSQLVNYGVERGNRETAIDVFLYNMCRDHGVQFEFGQRIKKLAEVPPGSIIATGLMASLSDFSNNKIISGHGYSFLMESQLGPASWQYADLYSPDYFYAVAMNGLLYGLLFGRNEQIDKEWTEVVDNQFYEREGIEIKGWKPFTCEVMMDCNLFFGPGNDYILTGSASGTFDPYFGFGIVGALTSGKISALAVRDPDGAQTLFDKVNRNNVYLYYLFEVLARLPRSLKWDIFRVLPGYYKYLKPIFGRIGHGIPGYPRDWIAEFLPKR